MSQHHDTGRRERVVRLDAANHGRLETAAETAIGWLTLGLGIAAAAATTLYVRESTTADTLFWRAMLTLAWATFALALTTIGLQRFFCARLPAPAEDVIALLDRLPDEPRRAATDRLVASGHARRTFARLVREEAVARAAVRRVAPSTPRRAEGEMPLFDQVGFPDIPRSIDDARP